MAEAQPRILTAEDIAIANKVERTGVAYPLNSRELGAIIDSFSESTIRIRMAANGVSVIDCKEGQLLEIPSPLADKVENVILGLKIAARLGEPRVQLGQGFVDASTDLAHARESVQPEELLEGLRDFLSRLEGTIPGRRNI